MATKVKGPKVRYGVVGGGWIAQAAFMPGVAQTDNSTMTALVSGDPEKRDKLAERYGLRAYDYDGYEAMLDSGEVDAIYLALPNNMHRDYAVAALTKGVHVLLEKPMATSVTDAEAIRAAAKETGAALMIAYRLHFEPATVAALEAVRSGKIGEPLFFTSAFAQHVAASNHRAKMGYWAGPVPDMGTYPLNAARNLFGAEPVAVYAAGVKSPGEDYGFDDTVAVTLVFPKGQTAQFTVSYAGNEANQYRLCGTKGDIELNPGFTFGQGLVMKTTVGTDKEEKTYPATDQFGGETQYFSACLLEGKTPEPGGEEGMLDVRVLEAVQRALETGEVQKIPPHERGRRIDPAQAVELKLAETPDLVNAAAPGEG
ncbi:MAG: Gfo/Idh/MocA family oxidoreductase [Geminicoccaceae bacterium]|nr:Gfo/Idh/MocA family oxidoreductase [Geminicoccaceae bacterium]